MARSASSASKTATEPASYELAVAELDRLVQQMEAGQMPLDQLLEAKGVAFDKEAADKIREANG